MVIILEGQHNQNQCRQQNLCVINDPLGQTQILATILT